VKDESLYPVPGTRHAVMIDLDDREPLTDTEAKALTAEFTRLIDEREQLSKRIRKVNQRLMLSVEAKVKKIHEEGKEDGS